MPEELSMNDLVIYGEEVIDGSEHRLAAHEWLVGPKHHR
jgi:hypothetical protein